MNRIPLRLSVPGMVLATACGLGVLMASGPAEAQVGPDALEAARYRGLHAAAHQGDVAQIEKLVGAKVDLNARDRNGRYDGTALIAAAHLGHAGVVRQLIAAGARHQATLKSLINAGASLKLTDRQGHTPLHLARTRGYREMVALLGAAGAK